MQITEMGVFFGKQEDIEKRLGELEKEK